MLRAARAHFVDRLPNLGAVELTVALHACFEPPIDRLVFDVGHQCYAHKLLTGRQKAFDTLRQFGGLSGFPRPQESPCDAFHSGPRRGLPQAFG